MKPQSMKDGTMLLRRLRTDESGVALVSVIMVVAMLTALGVLMVEVSTRNLTNANADRVATSSLGAAEAGVAAAEGYLNNANPQLISCSPNCTTNPWGNSASPQSLTFPNGSATVWIETVAGFSQRSGTYKIHSVGRNATGVRTIEQTVVVTPFNFPIGIYIDNKINDGGTAAVTNESVFSQDCIDSRSHINFSGIDPYYNIPAAAHSAKYVTTKNWNSCPANGSSDSQAIHNGTLCNTTYPYDQDSMGGTFPNGSSCSTAPNQYTGTSAFTYQNLVNDYGYQPKGLTDEQYAALKARAQAQGTYYTSPSMPTNLTPSTQYDPILYFDINPGQSVTLQNELAAYAYQTDPAGTCLQHPAVVLIVRGGDLKITSSAQMTGPIFVPEGTISYAGGAQLVGTIWAANMTITGNANVGLTPCYAASTPGGILNVTPTKFREVDR
jgi:Tfp pilus assembly protein PilX